MKKTAIALAVLASIASPAAMAAGFINGSFESGDTTGWTTGEVYRNSISNANLDPSDFGPTVVGRSDIITTGYVDPNVGALLGSTVYGGNFSYRVEDTVNGGFGSLIQQQVLNYTDPDIFFAWKAVLEGAHGANSAATMKIELRDTTDNVVLISRIYNAASGGGGVDARFSSAFGNFYTPQWQIEQLTIDASLSGHDFLLSVIAADCSPTGHFGYVYLDGFGSVAPPPGNGVPEPASLALLGLGLAGLAASRRRKSA